MACPTTTRGPYFQGGRDPHDERLATSTQQPSQHSMSLPSLQTAELCKAASEQTGKKVQLANLLCKGNYAVSGDMEAVKKVTGF